ncbi:unnamed protein product [Echinostoma caproni]|uniref:Reverse transcriptase n=1 Tax=Echinostoma caproni TaxID=27848 RepID=A0A183AXL7_9TREM|nr:unnamed protein product [Echinostoma caproni]
METRRVNELVNLEVGSPLGRTDQATIRYSYVYRLRSPRLEPRRCYSELDTKGLLLAASQLQWPEEAKDVHESWDRIKTNLISLADAFVLLRSHGRPDKPRWWSRRLAKLLGRKRAAWRRFTTTNGHSRYLQYLQERKTYDRAHSDSKKRYELTLAKKSKMYPKAYYGYVQSKVATSEVIGCIREAGGNPTPTSLEKASALHHHFKESYTMGMVNTLPAHSITTECPLDKLLIEPQEVEKNIEALDSVELRLKCSRQRATWVRLQIKRRKILVLVRVRTAILDGHA